VDKEWHSLSESQIEELSIIEELLYKWKESVWNFLSTKFHNGKFILIGHRRTLDLILREKRKKGEKLYDSPLAEMNFYEEYFVKLCLKEYKVEPGVYSEAYPVVASDLERSGYSRMAKFQSRYGFCRGMWVISFILALFYFLIIVIPPNMVPFQVLMYEPVITTLLGPQVRLIIVLLIITSLVFMNGAMRYKILLVEYLLAETYNLNHDDSGNTDDLDEIDFEELT